MIDAGRWPCVAVLLCTYNGETHLEEQLKSIFEQGFGNIDLWVSDDGSSDATLDILHTWQRSWTKGRFEIRQGPQQGFAANFLSLVCDPAIKADYFAYADQDDLWQNDKLNCAKAFFDKYAAKPALYCSRTSLVNENGKPLKLMSPLFSMPPSFSNALVQSLAGGNTMVMNAKARDLLLRAGPQDIVSHDWWTYMLVSGCGGEVFYDPNPSIQYRQHCDNKMGTNTGYIAKLKRLRMLMQGSFSEWNERNINSLDKVRYLLMPSSREVLDTFKMAREASLLRRLLIFRKSGVYRQTAEGNIALWFATLLKKL